MFFRYVIARYEQEIELYSFKTYVTDTLKFIAEGKSPTKRWVEIIQPSPEIDAKKVTDEIIKNAGLVVK